MHLLQALETVVITRQLLQPLSGAPTISMELHVPARRMTDVLFQLQTPPWHAGKITGLVTVMVNHHCQLDWILTHLGDISIGVSVKAFPERSD